MPYTRDSEDNVANLTDRMIRAAKLDIHPYEEVEADKQAMVQAMTAVILSRRMMPTDLVDYTRWGWLSV